MSGRAHLAVRRDHHGHLKRNVRRIAGKYCSAHSPSSWFARTATIAAAGFFAFGGAAIGARLQAAESARSYTTIVSYGDLNLDSERGAKVLYARIRSAAGTVCSPLEGRDLTEKKLWQGCFDKAVTSAVGQVNNTRVTALHNQMVNHTTKG
jgi:UrcA family protein